MFYFKLLIQPPLTSNIFNPVGYSANLILPSSTGRHDLFHNQNVCIKFFFLIGNSHKLKYSFYTGC